MLPQHSGAHGKQSISKNIFKEEKDNGSVMWWFSDGRPETRFGS